MPSHERTHVTMTKLDALLATLSPEKRQLFERLKKKAPAGPEGRSGDVAVIGLSGRYPMAADLGEFWNHLAEGKDCITEAETRAWAESFATDAAFHRGHQRWGGFLDDYDTFDPLFFKISPREAEAMDPQERLFLQTAWDVVEDAGYTPGTLTASRASSDGEVGVFVGVMYGHYEVVGLEAALAGQPGGASSSFASIANRVSFCLDFHGPSVALDTMCSSSLTAIHLATQSLRSGDCDVAIAGGVNLTVHPLKYTLLETGGFLSTDGRCRSFGQGGDGYVPGEGVGAVLLKPLEMAILDGDHIYCVIKGSAINHGGRANAYSVPNPNAQSSCLRKALRRARVEPRTISYVECHGTGTALGDPIEIRGMAKAFGALSDDAQCKIGSVKSNIGHLESAAGIAGLTKVVLQMQHKLLTPSIHSETVNPAIEFEATPFVLQRSLEPWPKPPLAGDGGQEHPRRAVVSSFGAGGSNAHLIVEEFEGTAGPDAPQTDPRQYLFVLSARSEERLRVYASRMLRFIEKRGNDSDHARFLRDLTYTLQVGRDALDERLAIVAADMRSLTRALGAYVDEHHLPPSVKRGRRPAVEGERPSVDPDTLRGELASLAELWVGGADIPWERLSQTAGRRIALPTYPFAKKRYWVPSTLVDTVPRLRGTETGASAHPVEGLTPTPAHVDAPVRTTSLHEQLRGIFVRVLKLEVDEFDPDAPFANYGVDSLAVTTIFREMREQLGLELAPTLVFEFVTLRALADHIVAHRAPHDISTSAHSNPAGQTLPRVRAAGVGEEAAAGPDLETLWAEAKRAHAQAADPKLTVESHLLPLPDGRAIEVVIGGSGPPLLMFTGLLLDHRGWNPQLDALGERYRLIMINTPGVGRSSIDRDRLSLESIVDDAAHALDLLGVTRPLAVLGVSFGGLLAQLFCIRHAPRASALVVALSTAKLAGRTTSFDTLLSEVQGDKRFAEIARDMDVGLYPVYGKLVDTFDVLERLPSLALPALVIAGEVDSYMLPAYSEEIHRTIAGSRLRVLAGARHLAPATHAGEFNRELLAFLKRVHSVAGASVDIGPPAYTPLTDIAASIVEAHVVEEKTSCMLTLSVVHAQLGYLINLYLNQGRDHVDYRCVTTASRWEAIDAALRLSRQKVQVRKPDASRIVIVDPTGELRDVYDPLDRGEAAALVPNLCFVDDLPSLELELSRTSDCCAVVLQDDVDPSRLDAVFERCREHGIVTILDHRTAVTRAAAPPRTQRAADIIVLGESIVDGQVPFGVCAASPTVYSPWQRDSEWLGRNIYSFYGLPALLAKETLLRHCPALDSDGVVSAYLARLEREQEEILHAHSRWVNPGLVEGLRLYGFQGQFLDATGSRISYALGEEHRQGIIDTFASVGTCVRGHNPPDVVTNVVRSHDRTADYWAELSAWLRTRTGYERAYPATSNSTAVEFGLRLALLANTDRKRVVFFEGAHAWTCITAAGGRGRTNLFRDAGGPFYLDAVVIDPAAETAASQLRRELESGEVAVVWFECMPVEWGGLKAIPPPLLDLVNECKSAGGYLVGVDETASNVVTGKLLSHLGRVNSPDLVAMASALGDSLVPAGLLLATEAVHSNATRANARAVKRMERTFVGQFGAHVALNALRRIDEDGLMENATARGRQLWRGLARIRETLDNNGGIIDIRGDGLLVCVEFDAKKLSATMPAPYVAQWLGHILFGECFRRGLLFSVCAMHFQSIKFTSAVTISEGEVDALLRILEEVLTMGMDAILESSAAFCRKQGNARLEAFYTGLRTASPPPPEAGLGEA
jgi:3-oxoacyl-(acyl-carrier-protein) synthase/acetylornithine/succinyldiaminopimelate/putrescine aminotransferase/pimeloyl-ACP methyl ester carboxylesterase/acyl carrier protein